MEHETHDKILLKYDPITQTKVEFEQKDGCIRLLDPAGIWIRFEVRI